MLYNVIVTLITLITKIEENINKKFNKSNCEVISKLINEMNNLRKVTHVRITSPSRKDFSRQIIVANFSC